MPEGNGRHILASFDDAMEALRSSVLMMASLAERSLINAGKGLFERDEDFCNVAIADDEEIDTLEIQIDREGVNVLTRFQPVASDLRHVITSMKSSVNIERVADQSVNIARRARKLSVHPKLAVVDSLEPMFAHASSMFSDAVRGFADGDPEIARGLKARDKELDVMNRDFAKVCTDLMVSDPGSVKGYLNLIFIARFLERIGDHSTNLGEDVVFSVEAQEIRHTQPAAPPL